jgi:hypothetical protein
VTPIPPTVVVSNTTAAVVELSRCGATKQEDIARYLAKHPEKVLPELLGNDLVSRSLEMTTCSWRLFQQFLLNSRTVIANKQPSTASWKALLGLSEKLSGDIKRKT